ncbi:MAG: hypothetical protein M3042_12585 [Actinomycetota bacterium]|nr:hypothetical protein [Actinomycetota bacterium]
MALGAPAVAALPSDVVRIWWVTLAVGLVVAVVVVVLLQLLLKSVERLRDSVDTLWLTATSVARNTATTWLLGQTAASVEGLRDEALRHDALLAAVLGSDGSAPPPPAATALPPAGGVA